MVMTYLGEVLVENGGDLCADFGRLIGKLMPRAFKDMYFWCVKLFFDEVEVVAPVDRFVEVALNDNGGKRDSFGQACRKSDLFSAF